MATRVEWKGPFNFNKIEENYEKLKNQKGVYLWVYDGNPKRVVYVGTGTKEEDGILGRLRIEKAQLLLGKHYCFKSDSKLDPYKEFLRKSTDEINKLASDGKFYYPDSKIDVREPFSNDDFLSYLNKLLVYTVDLRSFIDEDKIDDISKMLETQIQIYLSATNGIGYYKDRGFQSWLGKVEKLGKNNFKEDFKKLLDTQFEFSFPEIKALDNFSTERSLENIKSELLNKLKH